MHGLKNYRKERDLKLQKQLQRYFVGKSDAPLHNPALHLSTIADGYTTFLSRNRCCHAFSVTMHYYTPNTQRPVIIWAHAFPQNVLE